MNDLILTPKMIKAIREAVAFRLADENPNHVELERALSVLTRLPARSSFVGVGAGEVEALAIAWGNSLRDPAFVRDWLGARRARHALALARRLESCARTPSS